MSGWKLLKGRRGVVVDTMVWIYLFEDHPNYAPACLRLVQEAAAGLFSGVITPITAGELLVKPLRERRTDIADRYRSALGGFPNIAMRSLDAETGFLAGALRAKYGIPLPDAAQAAVALREMPATLVTNDKAMKKIAEVEIILLDDLVS